MPPVAVVTDTTHYLPREMVARRGVREVSLYVTVDGQPRREADLTDLDAFYGRLRRGGALPTTSQPSVGDVLAVWEPLLDAGHEIVSIHLAAGLSGTYDSALQARERLGERGERVTVIDSQTACGGLGMMVLAAEAVARAGGSRDDAVARAQEARRHLKVWFCLDTLEYLRRGGRVGAARAWLGSALKVKPILSVESEIAAVERVRTASRAFERMVDYLRERQAAGADAWALQHIQAPDQVARLLERGREIFGHDPLFVSEVGPVIGAHVGPGLLGVGGLPSRLLAA